MCCVLSFGIFMGFIDNKTRVEGSQSYDLEFLVYPVETSILGELKRTLLSSFTAQTENILKSGLGECLPLVFTMVTLKMDAFQ